MQPSAHLSGTGFHFCAAFEGISHPTKNVQGHLSHLLRGAPSPSPGGPTSPSHCWQLSEQPPERPKQARGTKGLQRPHWQESETCRGSLSSMRVPHPPCTLPSSCARARRHGARPPGRADPLSTLSPAPRFSALEPFILGCSAQPALVPRHLFHQRETDLGFRLSSLWADHKVLPP